MTLKKENTLNFKFDVSVYRLLGRELITDRITALFELVKNCYDANAENVLVKFENINPLSDSSRIIIEDDGIGMSLEDIRDKWMVIGTSSKRKVRLSPPPYNRKVVGKKGVGRFAVDKLGAKLLMKTTKKGSEDLICLETDWSYYGGIETQQLNQNFNGGDKLFTDVENKYWIEKTTKNKSGTSLNISMINDVWTGRDIRRSYKELSKLIAPSKLLKYPFNIVVNASEYGEFKNIVVRSKAIEIATQKIELGFDKNYQEILSSSNNELVKIKTQKRKCGFIRMTLYYFDQRAKNKFRKDYQEESIDGIKIYRDGVITTQFAEYNSNRDEQKDLLGIDKRRWSGYYDKVGSRDLLGWIEISDEENPDIIDSTNRQDFVDNEAWRELKRFVIEQIHHIEKHLFRKYEIIKEQTESEFYGAKDEIDILRTQLNNIKEEANDQAVKKNIVNVDKGLAKLQTSIKHSLIEYQKLERDKKRQENLFFSLISLQTYAGMLSHITRTSIGKIKREVEFINKWIPEPKFNDKFKTMAGNIFNEMNRLGDAVEFLLKYAKDDQTIEEISVKKTIENIFYDIYVDEFRRQNINAILQINENIILDYNLKSFEDIFDNLISNSFKALVNNSDEKIIKCNAYIEYDKFVILFSDNGYGIADEDKFRIFDVFYTTTSEEGGAGLGLFIVKSRLEVLNGTIEVIVPEFKLTGATFKIVLPFKNSNEQT